jgi:serine protease Do
MELNLSRPRVRRAGAVLGTLLLGTALGAGGVAWSSTVPGQTNQLALNVSATSGPLSAGPVAPEAGFADLVAKVQPAVVEIATTGQMPANAESPGLPQEMSPFAQDGSPFGDMLRKFFDERNGQVFNGQSAQRVRGLGSGFIVDPAGYIVTNNHVVDGAHDVKVTLTGGKEYTAKVIGRDPKTDLAVVKIDAGKPLPYVAFGDSASERDGEWVIAVGNPYGLGGTVTAGILSAHGRDINDGDYGGFLQIDAPINPGNSGGPLFNQKGQVIGVDTAIYSPSGGSVGIGFAIPSNLAKNVVAQLREHGKVERGWVGIQMQPLTPALAKAVGLPDDQGVLVNEVEKNSPASRAGLEQGDVITAFNKTKIVKPRDLALAVANTPEGKSVPMTIWRNEKSRNIDVTIGRQKAEAVAEGDSQSSPQTPVGMSLSPLTPAERDALGLDSTAKGVIVSEVKQGSKADESGVHAGDVIVSIGNDKVATPEQAARDIRNAEAQNKQAIPLLVTRNGTTYYLGLQLATS